MTKERCYNKELLDADYIADADLYLNLRELDTINNLLGGYNISFSALRKVLTKDRPATLVDIGCGGGDTLKRIHKWSGDNGYNTALYGVDLKPECIAYCGANNAANPQIQFICDDYRNVSKHVPQIDVLHACLFCHHLTENEIVELLQFALDNKTALVINDLERHPLAYHAIKWLTRFFSSSYLVKNDAPLSVLRGFKRSEWYTMLKKAGAKKFSVSNRWAFRHEIIVYAA